MAAENKKKSIWPRLLITGVIGAVVGFGFSMVSSHFGSSCNLMCNPPVASTIGAAFGILVGFPQQRS